jgi:hypothetical protein
MALTKVRGEGVGTLTSDLTIPDKIIHDGDTNTAIRFPSADTVSFETGGSERARVDSEGNLLIGTTTKETTGTTFYGSTANGFYIKTTGTCGYLIGPSGAGTFLSLYADSTAVGNISTNGSTTAYNTSSDYRLKESVTYDFDATTRLKQLKPARFNFIADADTTVDGFLAHEVQSVVPEAITGTHNEVDDDVIQLCKA